ncbi:MAG: hypothetical protein F6K03_16390 [Kamptonema sp. SIO4C4]|nr:hypothetical protein [Kamptonema sp. SIO4C4]
MNPHPLIGDRIYLLNRYANFWQLSPEIDLPTIIPPPQNWKERLIKFKNSYTALPILQSAVLSGLFFGIVSRLLLFLLGLASEIISRTVYTPVWRFIWFYNASLFLDACILVAFSLSIIIWINGYFPDIRIYPSRKNPRLEDLLSNPKSVPPRSYGISLKGKLIGRKGLSNWSAQDLMLKTSTGTIKLHFFSKLGPLGNLFPRPPRPETFINQEVTITGWFRRGGIPWIDVDIIRTNKNQGTRSGYPVWVTILALLAAIWSAYLISQA